MARSNIIQTGVERFFPDNEIIVSKTDKKGVITYANKLFVDIAEYDLKEIIGGPHNMVRHPHMPRCVFKLLWQHIDAGQELFAYVVNLAKNGDHYWVMAHVTPSRNMKGEIIGYHSTRRLPRREAVNTIQGIYGILNAEEAKHKSSKDAIAASEKILFQYLKDKGVDYDHFIHLI